MHAAPVTAFGLYLKLWTDPALIGTDWQLPSTANVVEPPPQVPLPKNVMLPVQLPPIAQVHSGQSTDALRPILRALGNADGQLPDVSMHSTNGPVHIGAAHVPVFGSQMRRGLLTAAESVFPIGPHAPPIGPGAVALK